MTCFSPCCKKTTPGIIIRKINSKKRVEPCLECVKLQERNQRKDVHTLLEVLQKKKKGIGLNITGKTKRRFLPNLKKKRLWFAEEQRFISLRLSCAAMRTAEKRGVAAIVRDLRKKGVRV